MHTSHNVLRAADGSFAFGKRYVSCDALLIAFSLSLSLYAPFPFLPHLLSSLYFYYVI